MTKTELLGRDEWPIAQRAGRSNKDEWVLAVGDEGTVEITDFAQEQFGDVVFFNLPEQGAPGCRSSLSWAKMESDRRIPILF